MNTFPFNTNPSIDSHLMKKEIVDDNIIVRNVYISTGYMDSD